MSSQKVGVATKISQAYARIQLFIYTGTPLSQFLDTLIRSRFSFNRLFAHSYVGKHMQHTGRVASDTIHRNFYLYAYIICIQVQSSFKDYDIL